MSFNENLIRCRKQKKLSQEQLAQLLGVSRQTIYKWETGQTYPEIDRLVILSNLFECSLDDLIKNEVGIDGAIDMEEEITVSSEVIEKTVHRYAFWISLGIFLILTGVSLMLGLFQIFKEDNYLVPLITFFVFLIAAILMFVYFGMDYDHFKQENPDAIVIFAPIKKKAFFKKFTLSIVFGISFIIIGVLWIIIAYTIFPDTNDDLIWPVSPMLFLIGIAVFLFSYYGILQEELYHLDKKQYRADENSLSSKIQSIIMIIATIVFLILGFGYHLWHPGWVVYPVGGLICGIVSILFSDKK